MLEYSFFSLEVRDINFDYDRYYLSLEDIDNKLFIDIDLNDKNNEKEGLPKDAISGLTSYTVIPKFPIDKVFSPILYQIFNIDYNLIKIKEENQNYKKKIIDEKNKNDDDNKNKENIIDEEKIIIKENNEQNEKEKDNKENNENNKENENNKIKELKINVKSFTTKEIICSFDVRYPLFPEYIDVLGKTPDKFKILQFPCIILQSETGYYSLKKIVLTKKNNKLIEEEINFAIKYEPEKHLETLFTKRQKPMKKKVKNKLDFEKIMQLKALYDSTFSNLEDKKQELLNKKKELNSLIEERKKILKEKQNILTCHKNIELMKNSWNRLITLKETLTKINSYTAEIISIKEKKISSCKEEIKKYKNEVQIKRKKDIPNLQKINNGLIVTNYLLYKYSINELCYYFFNKNINIYKAFPSFYKINLTDLSLSKKIVEDFYNKNTKPISAMFGNIIFLINYLSKKFDIILPYALYYNGSKSMIFTNMSGIIGKNLSIDMYMKENERNVLAYGTKNENDIQIKIEILAKMIYDVIMFFYSKKICSDKFNIESINGKKNKNNAYLNFMKLNELFKDILGKDDIKE